MDEELKQIKMRVNGIYDNEKTVNLVGYQKVDGENKNISATIWKYKQDGETSKAYENFLGHNPQKGDLIETLGDRFGEFNGNDQYTIRVISDMVKSKFEPKPVDDGTRGVDSNPDPTKINTVIGHEGKYGNGFINSEEKAEVEEVPWALEL